MNTRTISPRLINALKRVLILLTVLALTAISVYGCKAFKISKPILPIQEYERMLVGRLDADYVGNEKCLFACHSHEKIKRDFEASTMGAQLRADSGLPLVNCESCHGPGSLAVAGITQEKVAADARLGKTTSCNYETFTDIKNLPSQAQSLICLKCHTANATFNLHNWNSGVHSINDVSCISCHNIHAGPDLITRPNEINRMCFKCHQRQEAEFLLPNHHPVMENRMFCIDCHESMGTVNDKLLREDTVKETCTRCHGNVEGPYAYEHADVTDDCGTCHNAHGSVNDKLLKVGLPFLCLQCHGGHRISNADSYVEAKGAFYTRCTDCHSQIHGTDLPSATGKGAFTH